MRDSDAKVIESLSSRAACLCFLLLSACGAGDADLGYNVVVHINGTPLAFEGRSIEVGSKVAPSPNLDLPAGPGMLGVRVELCTKDHTKFVTGPVRIVVTGPEGTLSDVSLQRVACRDSREGGRMEENHLFLEDSGFLDTEFGRGTQVWATCSDGWLVPCPVDTF